MDELNELARENQGPQDVEYQCPVGLEILRGTALQAANGTPCLEHFSMGFTPPEWDGEIRECPHCRAKFFDDTSLKDHVLWDHNE